MLTVTAYPYEKPISINGLNVELSGSTSNSAYIVKCKRSNVTFEDLVISNTSTTASPEGAVQIYDCVNITFNNPDISGLVGSGDKYGITLGISANIDINDGDITKTGHGITGRHSKNVSIMGGYYAGVKSGIDNHWGNGFFVQNATIVGEAGVTYSGTDVTVRDCNFIDCINIFTVRMDTPEVMGDVILENITAKSPSNYKTMYCYRSNCSANIGDFGRTLAVPDSVTIANVTATIPSDGYLYYGGIIDAFDARYAGKITFTNIKTLGGIGTIKATY